MARAVIDTSVLVSAFLTRVAGGVSFELLRLAQEERFEFFLSEAILDETALTLLRAGRTRRRYLYADAEAIDYCQALSRLAAIVADPPEVRVVRDPNDDMIVACALGAHVDYIVTRDKDLLSLDEHAGIKIVTPEAFLGLLREGV